MKYSDHQRVNKIYEYASKLNQCICEKQVVQGLTRSQEYRSK